MSTYEKFLSRVEVLLDYGLDFDQAASEIIHSFSEEEQQEINRAYEESQREHEEWIEPFHGIVIPVNIPY